MPANLGNFTVTVSGDSPLRDQLDRIENKLDRLLDRDENENENENENDPPEPPDHDDDSDDDDSDDDEPDEDDQDDEPAGTGIAAEVFRILPTARDWTCTLPSGKPGSTDSPNNDYLTRFTDAQLRPYLRPGRDEHGEYVDFRVKPASVVTTKNSKYGRTELRQTEGAGTWQLSGWSSAGPRQLSARLAIDASGLVNRKRVNGLQIHDGSDDVMQVMRRGPQLDGDANDVLDYGLGVMYKDGQAWLELDVDYRDGQVFECVITVSSHKVKIAYVNLDTGRSATVSFNQSGSGWYFKAGDYVQTGGRSVWREPASAEASVRLYALSVA